METRLGIEALKLETGGQLRQFISQTKENKANQGYWAGKEEITLRDNKNLKSVRLRDQLYLIRT